MEFFQSEIFNLLVLPVMIFFARVADVSLGTLRIIFISKGHKFIAPVLGFFEIMIWLLAASRVFENLDNWIYYIAYAAGFATGVYVGIIIEEKIALGVELIRIITHKDATDLINTLKEKGFGITYLTAHGSQGEVGIIYSIIKRTNLNEFISFMKKFNPNAFYTIEDIRFVNKNIIHPLSNTLLKKRLIINSRKA